MTTGSAAGSGCASTGPETADRSGKEQTALKLGRYKFEGGKKLESETPKSELTLDPEELEALLRLTRPATEQQAA